VSWYVVYRYSDGDALIVYETGDRIVNPREGAAYGPHAFRCEFQARAQVKQLRRIDPDADYSFLTVAAPADQDDAFLPVCRVDDHNLGLLPNGLPAPYAFAEFEGAMEVVDRYRAAFPGGNYAVLALYPRRTPTRRADLILGRAPRVPSASRPVWFMAVERTPGTEVLAPVLDDDGRPLLFSDGREARCYCIRLRWNNPGRRVGYVGLHTGVHNPRIDGAEIRYRGRVDEGDWARNMAGASAEEVAK
jgi:hypothetical protein